MDQALPPVDVDQAQSIGVGDVVVIVGRVDLAGNQELPVADGIGMRVEAPTQAFPIVYVLAISAQETPNPVLTGAERKHAE